MTPLDLGLASVDGFLVVVDVVALAISVSIKRTVTRIVSETAADMGEAVQAGIADAVDKVATLAAGLFAGGRPEPGQVLDAAREAAGALHHTEQH